MALASLTASADSGQIVVQTDNTGLVFTIADNGRVYQSYLGKRLADKADYSNLTGGREAYITHGMEDYFEPALHVNHSDDNPSTLLTYVSHISTPTDWGTRTVISLADKVYGDKVDLYFDAYDKCDVITTWSEITNGGKTPVEIEKFASSMLHFDAPAYYLTEFSGDWATEVRSGTQELKFGKKILDTKLGSRANMHVSPFFELGLGAPVSEDHGDVLVGTLAWTGNFQFCFEVDNDGQLRVISGINPYFSRRTLKKGETFRTPDFIFTLSGNGAGEASRNLHEWARHHRVKDGTGNRMTLLNNWEATYFDFDQDKLISLIGEAKELGVDMFLLDDGWFGTKYPRSSDHQGLGDWIEIKDKLPDGIGRLTEEAAKQGIKFGLWIEPEMVNPKSELYEKHKDWVITLPNREEYHFRNQLVLDLSNPQVQDYVYGIVDGLMTRYPDIAFFKWDCNSPITNIYSQYEKGHQQQLYVDHVHGLYKVLDRIKEKYPDLPMMLCSGGGGRTDYEALKYFTEFWPSDNTDPVERLFIQWGYSQVFPSKVQCAHVTTWHRQSPIKFRVNVAMMGKMGFDINLHDIGENDLAYCKQSVKEYNALKPIILDGDQYRLVSPYEGNHTATSYVSHDKKNAVLFAFDIYPRYNERMRNVKLQGLEPSATYEVEEINRPDGSKGAVSSFSGDYLMTVGIPVFSGGKLSSRVYTLKAK
ncbi:MAG: alpha-galactosidase [Muribaculaceae bacterium]|nr:alpha-galactosidase [Muribaculaceae bacterium]MDE6610878.1 alpha-galactosidase [Muribaculaceae bacterium]